MLQALALRQIAAPTDRRLWLLSHTLLALFGVGLADWLLLGYQPGLSVALVILTVACLTTLANRVRAGGWMHATAWTVLIACLLPMLESPSLLSFLFCIAGVCGFATLLTGGGQRELTRMPLLLLVGVFRLNNDVGRLHRIWRRRGKVGRLAALLTIWVVPVLLFLVFLVLFGAANPLLEEVLSDLNPLVWLADLSPLRVLFWILALHLIWPFIHMRRAARRQRAIRPLRRNWSEIDPYFGRQSLLVSLMLFNALFAFQTLSDVAYLWRGLSLPNGISYAGYAHRGAYPLVVTALLAAFYVLIAMRKDGPAAQSRWITPLVLVWVAQNIGLVISSMLRLKLYVTAFGLTDLRISSFLWMVLVAVGLGLILVKVVAGKSNLWLLKANALALTLMLYGISFLDYARIEADFNITHCLQVSGSGPDLDMAYLVGLGAAAVPVLDRLSNDHLAKLDGLIQPDPPLYWIAKDALALRSGTPDWRSWNAREWRLRHYLLQRDSPFLTYAAGHYQFNDR